MFGTRDVGYHLVVWIERNRQIFEDTMVRRLIICRKEFPSGLPFRHFIRVQVELVLCHFFQIGIMLLKIA